MEPRDFLRALFDAALDAALPRPEWYAGLQPISGRTIVIGAGKAAASMARAFEEAWPGPLEGLVVTRYGHAVPCVRIEVIQAGHPVPDASGLQAAERILALVSDLGPDDRVVALISGGGSSLLALPAPGITLAEKQSVTRDLLRSGATIREINAVRRRLSAVKGGRLLAAAAPARVVTYVVSDVVSDDPSVVASGPTVPNTGTDDALATLARYGIAVPSSVRSILEAPQPHPESPSRSETVLVASARLSLEAAARRAEELGVRAHVLSDAIEGEAREVAKVHAAIAREVAAWNRPFKRPCVLLSGGETTVVVRGGGRGGRNVEFVAALAQALGGRAGTYALAADTDGVDGMEETAGAFIDPTTFSRAGVRLTQSLAENDAHALFEALGDRLVTGPTRTNVNDFRAVLIQ